MAYGPLPNTGISTPIYLMVGLAMLLIGAGAKLAGKVRSVGR